MRHEVKIPDIGEDVSELEISEWHVNVGDSVTNGAHVAELLAEKAAVELVSDADGVVTEILKPEGSIVSVGEAVLALETG
jgi:2-oxoisovalerate dehydrogenase E2 component (dihydrolipoyl transacylase)